MKGLRTIIAVMLLSALLGSCNWNIINGDMLDVERNPSSSSSSVLFTGAAPRNLRVSQAAFSDRITLSFSSVKHAEYYMIYRAEVDSSFENIGGYDSLYWTLIDSIDADGKNSMLYSDTQDLSATADKAYLYVVQAHNDNAEMRFGVKPQFSKVEKGWLLTPPQTVSADQGVATDYIEIRWSGVEKVQSYDIQTSTDRIDWVDVKSGVPPLRSGNNSFYYYPDSSDYGKQLYFRIISVQSSSKSSPSVTRIGYTYVEGAPSAPTGVSVSKAGYGDRIAVEWDVPAREAQTDGGYTWEITRMAPGEEEIVVATFQSVDEVFPAGVTRTGDTYRFEDMSGLEPNITYEYSVKASCLVDVEGSGEMNLPGPAVRDEGYLLSPPTSFESSVDYGSGKMAITIDAPLGFDDDRDWEYLVEGSLNGDGAWKEIERVPVKEEVTREYDFSTVNANDFRFSVLSGSEKSASSAVVSPDEIKANDFTVVPNMPPDDSSLSDANGLYPVAYTATAEAPGVTMEIEVNMGSEGTETFTVDADKITSGVNALEISPSELFVKYSYRARKMNPFGRTTGWTAWQEGWGAMTDEAYVRMFEKWILKPWEYRSEMSAELQSKWNPDKNGAASNQLSYKIYNPGISSQGDVTVGGNAGGTLRYFTGNVSITNMSADITFVYNAFGERAELRGTGQYVMKGAKMSGWGSGVVGNLVIESQMYPGEIDFNSLNTNNQKFSGNYLVKQGWSDVYAEVSSE